FSSHILQEVEALCDRVVIINRGKLVADNRLSVLRSQNDVGTIRVSFKEAPAPSHLEGIKDIITARPLTPYEWEFQTDNPDDVKKQLLELALQNNWNIVSLQSEKQSLEEIFRQLTN